MSNRPHIDVCFGAERPQIRGQTYSSWPPNILQAPRIGERGSTARCHRKPRWQAQERQKAQPSNNLLDRAFLLYRVGTAGFEPVGYGGIARIDKPFLRVLVGMWWV